MRSRPIDRLFALTVVAAAAAYAALPSTPLIDAVKKGDAATVRSLIAKKADLNATDSDGATALHWAAQQNRPDIAAALIDAGAKINVATRYSMTPLALAAKSGSAAIVDRLLKAGVDPNSTSGEGETALMTASLNGNLDAVKLLLTHEAKVNAAEPFRGQTALMWASGEGNAKVAELLVEFGANVKAKSKSGFTPFLFAVRNHRIDAAKVLLDHGANVNDTAPDGTTALTMSIVNGYYDLGSVLLDYKADPNAKDSNGSPLSSIGWMRKPGTPWEAAALGEDPLGPPRQTGDVTSLELAEKLLNHGADPNARITWKEMHMTVGLGTTRNPPNIPLGRHYLSFVGATPFYVAARNGDSPYMRLLVKHGADPMIPTEVGVTPLMAAAGLDYYEGETPGPFNGVSEAERLEAVKLCLELGNDINARTHLGDYPMIGSTEYTLLDYPENMNDLLDLGVGDPRWDGMTPIFGAIISNQPLIVQYLVDQGAQLDAKNRLGWTPLMITRGLFMANSKKLFPVAEQILTKTMIAKGMEPK